jgi:hypothetical protein
MAVSVILNVPAVVGVPEMVAPLKNNPSGRGAAVNVIGVVPFAMIVYLKAAPTIALTAKELEMTGFVARGDALGCTVTERSLPHWQLSLPRS